MMLRRKKSREVPEASFAYLTSERFVKPPISRYRQYYRRLEKRISTLALFVVVILLLTASAFSYAFNQVVVPNFDIYKAFSNLSHSHSSVTTETSIHISTNALKDIFAISDAQLASAQINNINTVSDLSGMIDRVSMKTQYEKTSNPSPNLRFAIQYDNYDLFAATLFDRTLYLSTDALGIARQDPNAPFTPENIQGLPALYNEYSLISGTLDSATYQSIIDDFRSMVSGTPLAYTFLKGTSSGNAFDSLFAGTLTPNKATSVEDSKIIGFVASAFRHSASVTPNGSDSNGDIVDITVNMDKAYAVLTQNIADFLKNNPGSYPNITLLQKDLASAQSQNTTNSVPRIITLETWIKNDQFTQMRLDLRNLTSKYQTLSSHLNSSDFYLQIKLSYQANILAPTKSIPVNSLLAGLTGGDSSLLQQSTLQQIEGFPAPATATPTASPAAPLGPSV